MEEGTTPSPQPLVSSEETKEIPAPDDALSEGQRALKNDRLWLEQRKTTHPQEFDEDGNYLTFEEMEAREKAARIARIAKLFAPPPEPPRAPPPPLVVPDGNVADLLEKQVAICAGLIGNVAEFIAGDARPENCFPFMDRIARLMSSSAKAGRTIGQLRGIAAETKQTFVKRKENGREGATA
jgi:hypothetical protein